jgi:hypothetical protein
MSSSIWTRCAGASEVGPLRLEAWRSVEAQHQVATRKLVDTLEEHEVLEALIEGAKPPLPPGPGEPRRLHYLLATPFRYRPLRHGSRFGRRTDPGIWYGAETVATVLAEVAYYRLVFLEGTAADLGAVTAALTLFSVAVRTERGMDLLAAPWAAHAPALASPVDYGAAQALGGDLRAAGVEAFRYASARDRRWEEAVATGARLASPAAGVNVGVLAPAAFGAARPRAFETWHCTATRRGVDFLKRSYGRRRTAGYAREVFEVEGRLPAPAV